MQSLHEESVYANNLMTVFTSSFYQAICAWHYILLVKEPKSCFYLCFEVFTIENGFAFKPGNNDKGLGFSKCRKCCEINTVCDIVTISCFSLEHKRAKE